MQDVHSFLELGDVHHPEGTARIPDADFPSPGTHIIEGFPVVRVKSSLRLIQLETRLPASFWGYFLGYLQSLREIYAIQTMAFLETRDSGSGTNLFSRSLAVLRTT
jgi:hypothetical protein